MSPGTPKNPSGKPASGTDGKTKPDRSSRGSDEALAPLPEAEQPTRRLDPEEASSQPVEADRSVWFGQDDLTGRTISQYKILSRLGEGGMGVVYKARDTRLNRTVALKFLSSQLLANKEAKQRFLHEAQVAAALDDPHICTVHEIHDSAPDAPSHGEDR